MKVVMSLADLMKLANDRLDHAQDVVSRPMYMDFERVEIEVRPLMKLEYILNADVMPADKDKGNAT